MNIFDLDPNNDEHVEVIARWGNDAEIFALTIPVRMTDFVRPVETVESVRERYLKDPLHTKRVKMIYVDDRAVGYYSLQMNPSQCLRLDVSTAWPGITIGERSLWGSGIAAQVMKRIEEEGIGLEAKRIELGTFQFNLRAQKFYQKLGYVEFARIKSFTFHDGRFWDDLRMEKNL